MLLSLAPLLMRQKELDIFASNASHSSTPSSHSPIVREKALISSPSNLADG